MAQPVGLQVQRVTGQEAPAIQPADIGSVGMVVRSKRGIIGKRIRLTSFNDAYTRLGGIFRDSNGDKARGITAIREMFDNARPYAPEAYVVRVDEGQTSASTSTNVTTGKTVLQSKLNSGADPVWVEITSTTSDLTLTIQDSDTSPTVTETYTESLDSLELLWQDVIANSALVRVTQANTQQPADQTLTQSTLVDGTHTVTLTPSTVQNATIVPGQRGFDDPGSWANQYRFVVSVTPGSPLARDIQIQQIVQGEWVDVGQPVTELEEGNFVETINDEATGSLYLKVDSAEGLLPDAGTYRFQGGADGTPPTGTAPTAFVGTTLSKEGLHAFDDMKIDIIGCPELETPSWVRALDDYLLGFHPESVGVFNTPVGVNPSQLLNYEDSDGAGFQEIRKRRSKVAGYKGFETVRGGDLSTGKLTIPVLFSVVGSGYIRKMFNRTGLPSVAPGGHGAALRGVVSMEQENYTQGELETLLRDLGINAVMRVDGVGFVPRSSELISTQNKWKDVHKERSEGFLIRSFENSLGFIEQEPNTPETRRKLVDTINVFLADLYSRGMFDQSGEFEDAVEVKCDSENNDEQDKRNRRLNCRLSLDFVDVVETAYINLNRVSGQISASAS